MSKRQRTTYRVAVAVTGALFGFGGCAADPEGDSLGSCTLSCSQPKVASSDYVIEPVSPASMDIRCGADPAGAEIYPLNGPVRVQFRVYKNEAPFGWPKSDDGGGGGGGGGGGAAALLQDASAEPPILPRIPRSGIGFEPQLTGLMSIEDTNSEFKTDDTTASSFKFAGVVTPSSEWCSDTCGVITYEFWPMCATGGNPVSAGILMHGVTPPEPISVSVSP